MATVRGKLPAARTVSPDERKRERRLLLPSNRVAVLRLPNVGEYLELRAEAVRRATELGKPTDQSIGIELGQLVVRRQLVGLTARPVESVLKPGTDLVAVRAKLIAEGVVEELVDQAVVAAEDAAEDAEATKAAARPAVVNDLSWDEQEGEVGEYLAAMPKAMLDEPEGADWQALHDYATLMFPSVMRGLDTPPKARPRIRSLR